jgi:hypothetical protein
VEELGSEVRNAARSHLRRLIEHALKPAHSPASDPRSGWRRSMDDARDEIADRLTPTIRRDLEAELSNLYGRAASRVGKALIEEGEAKAANAVPSACPYELDTLLEEDWYPQTGSNN